MEYKKKILPRAPTSGKRQKKILEVRLEDYSSENPMSYLLIKNFDYENNNQSYCSYQGRNYDVSGNCSEQVSDF